MNLPKSLLGKVFWTLRHRPLQVWSYFRGFWLFRVTHMFRGLLPQGVQLGENVRVQRLRCLHAEGPEAKIILGNHSIVYEYAKLEAYGSGRMEFGECAVLGDIRMASRVSIKVGKRFITSWNVFIQDFDPHPVDAATRGKQIEAICSGFRPRFGGPALNSEKFAYDFPGSPIEIGDDVWVGANATILKGARIGNGCIVATGAVVLKGDYPAASLIAGNPAKVVKTFS